LISKVSPMPMGRDRPSLSRSTPKSSRITVLGMRRSSSRPAMIFVGAPISVSLSRAVIVTILEVPSVSRANGEDWKSGTAQATPSTERTRVVSVSRMGLLS
jgi:hypothetical protein